MYSLKVLLSQFWTNLLFHVWFSCFLICIQVSQQSDKMVWYSHIFKNSPPPPPKKYFPPFAVIHTVKGLSIVSEDVFLELPCFLHDPTNFGNLISGSSVFSKSSLHIWKFSVHVLLKPSLKDFWALPWQHVKWVYLYSSLNILWHCPSLGLEWKLTFSSPVATVEFSKFCGIMSAL